MLTLPASRRTIHTTLSAPVALPEPPPLAMNPGNLAPTSDAYQQIRIANEEAAARRAAYVEALRQLHEQHGTEALATALLKRGMARARGESA